MSNVYYSLMAECRDAQAKAYSLEAAAARISPYTTSDERLRRELLYLELAASAREGAETNRRVAETYS